MDDVLSQVADAVSWRQALLAMLLGYVLTQAIAAVYVATYRGVSYARTFAQTLVVSGVVSAMLMLAIGNSLARGIGIVGTLALIRFRTTLRDPLDMLFVFAAFGAGIAAGVGSYATAVIGTVVFLVVVASLRLSRFGARQLFDGVLRLQLPADGASEDRLLTVLRARCRGFVLITLRDVAQGAAQERAYQVTLRQRHDEAALVAAIAALPGASGVAVAMQEATLEL